jgi:hypothetical protein
MRCGFSIKGSWLRGLLLALEAKKQLTQVERALSASPATLALVLRPPLSSEWLKGEHVAAFSTAMLSALGRAATQQVSRESVLVETGPLSRSITEGLLRVFGNSPEVLFRRLPMFDSVATRGVRNEWSSLSPKTGQINTLYEGSANLPEGQGVVAAGMFECVLDLCRASGRVQFAGWFGEQRSQARFHVSW